MVLQTIKDTDLLSLTGDNNILVALPRHFVAEQISICLAVCSRDLKKVVEQRSKKMGNSIRSIFEVLPTRRSTTIMVKRILTGRAKEDIRLFHTKELFMSTYRICSVA